jgi:hypothetical protein
MHRVGVRILRRRAAAWALAVALTAAARPLSLAAPEADSLGDLLRGLDRASRLYLDSVLRFSCDETLRESGKKNMIRRYNYIFVYDPKKGFVDFRTAGGRSPEKSVDPAELGFRYLQRSYFWVLVFHKTRQPLHRYKIEGREVVLGREAVKVSFEPVKPYKEKLNDWAGTAWVDPQTFQLLRVEAMTAEDRARFIQMQADRVTVSHGRPVPLSRWVVDLESVTTDFSFEKNGMRFPGETDIELTQYLVPFNRPLLKKDTLLLDRTEQKYTHYQFFGVRTESEVHDIVSGSGENPSPP